MFWSFKPHQKDLNEKWVNKEKQITRAAAATKILDSLILINPMVKFWPKTQQSFFSAHAEHSARTERTTACEKCMHIILSKKFWVNEKQGTYFGFAYLFQQFAHVAMESFHPGN